MRWRFSSNATPSQSAVAVVLLAVVFCAPEARGQVDVGPVTIGVPGAARGDVTTRTILAAVRIAERVARERREGAGAAGRRPETSRGNKAPSSESSAPAASAARVLPTAERYLGVPYRWGGTSPRTGFDCSGFVQYVFAKHGTRLPRTAREQASAGQRASAAWSTLRPGDLVMFAEPGERISHVAIYAGHRRIIHATSSGKRVRYDDLDTRRGKWFAQRLVAARRVSPRGAALVSNLLAQLAPAAPGIPLDPPDHAPSPREQR
jgi:cell wall-associated NlpC family hydrolase